MQDILEQGLGVTIETPHGDVLEGTLCQAIDLENLEPFAIIELDSKERLRITNPWDCEIETN